MSTINSSADDQSRDEEVAFRVFSVAIEKYLATLDGIAQEEFETWLDDNAETEDLFPHLLQKYPKFGDIFVDEIEALNKK